MPTLRVNGQSAEVAEGTRLVLAIKAQGVTIGHRCGGHARCTTCRVQFSAGEPEAFTEAEYKKLGLEPGKTPDYRLSCQVVCDRDMSVEPLMTLENQTWSDTGPALDEQVQPEAVWLGREELETEGV